jgi:transcriptional regulator with XRE-family HTH domain
MNNLKKYRESLGISQTALANRTGCARSYISEVESGQVRLTLKMARRFADALHQDPFALLGSDAIKYDGSFRQTMMSLTQDKFDAYVEMQITNKCTRREFEEFMLCYWLFQGGLSDKDVSALEGLASALAMKKLEAKQWAGFP